MPLVPNKGLCAIEITLDGVAVAYTPDPSKREITVCDFQPYPSNNRQQLDHGQVKESLKK